MAKGKVIVMKTKEGNASQASIEKPSADHYHELLKINPLNQKAYTQLMILYRRNKEYKKELGVIESGIKAFESLYSGNKSKGAAVSRVSKQLNLAFGLIDKKGKMLFDQEPIATWKKRKKIVLDKLHTKNKK